MSRTTAQSLGKRAPRSLPRPLLVFEGDALESVGGDDMRVSSGNVTITYEVTGGGQKPIVFLPALGTTCEIWQPQIVEFVQDYMVICCETGGNLAGGDSHPRLPDYSSGVAATLDAVGVLEAHVVGISMGGMIAQELAIQAPERVSSLVLASTTSTYPPQMRQQIAHRAQVARTEGMQALVEATLDRWFTPEFGRTHPEEVDRVRQILLRADPEAYADAALAVSAVDTSERLPGVSAPTLVLEAEYDASMPPMAAESLVRRIPAARLGLIPDSAHLSNLGNPGVFNDLVARFLLEVDSDPDSGAATVTLPW